ncbi:hypothetical protein J437_LFUL011603 [Ladona fulva]|uniref:Uncharacterized protein n=1 Tax=Ladona fulva TaxID=123851 RepID=A0A8K0KG20_LADFU|nr:hypothetical protein J437_LFUL011603 [Ladona fulva]
MEEIPCRTPPVYVRDAGKTYLPTMSKLCGGSIEVNCHHNEQERDITDIWFSDEVKKAIEKGYKHLKL